jgi:tetratricopeptide (TPR) repeat protein
MSAKHLFPASARTLADELRDDLERCEEWVTQIGAGADGLALLRLLDQVADELERLEGRGVDLRAERGRWEGVLAQLDRRGKALVAQVGATMATQRPPGARWWWRLDERVAADRQRRLKRAVVGTLLGIGILALAFLFYERVLAPPPHIRQANARFFEGEQLINEGKSAQAIEQFEAATALDPERTEAHLWLGVLYQATGDAEQAAAAFERAKMLLGGEQTLFLFQRGIHYLALNDTDAAYEDALTIIEAAPDWPEGYFLLGSVAECSGDLELAVVSFRQADALAGATGDAELQVAIRMRLATTLEALMANPGQ